MICTSCQKEPAVLFIKQIVNNRVSQKALCASCSQTSPQDFSPANALLELLSSLSTPRARTHPARCQSCQMSFAEFKNRGRFGCPACYGHFTAQLKGLIPRIHAGAYRHRGKTPKRRGERPTPEA
jgi:protein arginine kinase activator